MTSSAPDRNTPPLHRAGVGVGFKPAHEADIVGGGHGLDFFEVHAENYMGEGGRPHRLLADLRALYPLSLHGVGLSIGGAGPLDQDHLRRLKHLIDRYQPALFSEHLAWSTHEGAYFNDLLPLPYNQATLAHVTDHIDEVQETLQRAILLENPSTYVAFKASTMSETEFLRAIVQCTGCELLLDVNNVYVSAVNHDYEPMAYLDAFPMEHVSEVHHMFWVRVSDELHHGDIAGALRKRSWLNAFVAAGAAGAVVLLLFWVSTCTNGAF